MQKLTRLNPVNKTYSGYSMRALATHNCALFHSKPMPKRAPSLCCSCSILALSPSFLLYDSIHSLCDITLIETAIYSVRYGIFTYEIATCPSLYCNTKTHSSCNKKLAKLREDTNLIKFNTDQRFSCFTNFI